MDEFNLRVDDKTIVSLPHYSKEETYLQAVVFEIAVSPSARTLLINFC